MKRSGLAVPLVLALVVCTLVPGNRALADGKITGLYASGEMAGAESVVLRLEHVGRGVVGQLTDENGRKYALRGKGSNQLIEGKIFHHNRSTNFSVERVGASLFLTYMPIDARTSRSRAQRNLLLRKQGDASIPAAPARTAATEFSKLLSEYQNWSDDKVARKLDALSRGHRSLVQLFSYLHADLYIRSCRAQSSGIAATELGWSQSLSCKKVLRRVGASANHVALRELTSRAKQQAVALQGVVGCAGIGDGGAAGMGCDRLGVAFSPVASSWRDVAVLLPANVSDPAPVTVASIVTPVLKPTLQADAGDAPAAFDNAIVPTLKPTAHLEIETRQEPKPASLAFRRLPVNWEVEAKAQLHEWSLAFADNPLTTLEDSVGTVVPSPSAPR